ncbi:RHS repeat-associated core domain-containing protein [Fervidibacter sacchari]|uniref:RHS repeat-associated protein n=1 Tax=Candidatus Fervidibacter sacchari TaxID=1448929 RepID=A0ABT2EJ98_9BACT|nr:RHS repeat-associated core domain-containing protein [Candidatus Fervidibacter sacchari]MCS3918019.1 RHS repeat-associated protein [Candidatus Fervidibacter sacchari]WKU15833.1 RHS repeat-associated core domain-containing protein [Candidatus Fervidibacter sacchari]
MVQIEYRRTSDNSLLSRFVYSYDAAGNRVQVQEEVLQPDGSWSVATVSYGYDQIDRLVSEKRTGSHPYWYDYGYDGSGNRLVMVQRDGSGNIVGQKSYNYDGGNKLLQEVANGVTTVYQYDPNGNTISKTTGTSQVRYYWDDEDKMVRVEDSVVMNFKTDGLGFRRMKEVVGQGQTWFVYDLGKSETPGLAPLVAEYDQNGNLVAKYHHDGGGLMAMTRNNASYWYAFEAIGTARQLMDSQSQVSDAYAFDAWGNDLTSPQSQVPNPFRYIGKHGYYWDTQSSLMLLGVRYYQAGLGRFMTIDPLKITNNWYVYTSNRPTMLIDPNGKIAIIPILCASACACVALCGIAVIGGCIAGCHDAGNLSWQCVDKCVQDMLDEIPPFQRALCEGCFQACGYCIFCWITRRCPPPGGRIKPIEPPINGNGKVKKCPKPKPDNEEACRNQHRDCIIKCGNIETDDYLSYLLCIQCCTIETDICMQYGPGLILNCDKLSAN